MNPLILNRDFEHPSDGWYQIEPKGEHPNRPAGVVQVIDGPAIDSIVNRFNTEARGPNFAGMLVDHEHFKHDTDKETIAYGWLTQLQNREDGVYGQIRWTGTGRAAVDSGDYRFFSTEYDPGEVKILNDGRTPKRIRPLRLDGLTLTNNPNNKGGKPITNRTEPIEFRHGVGAPTAETETKIQNQRNQMKSVATQLKLSADASEEAVLAELNKIINRATTLEGELAPLKNRVTELETSNKTLLDEQVDGLLTEYGVTEEKIFNRLKPVLLGFKNRGERVSFLTDMGIEKPEAAGKGHGAKSQNGNEGRQIFNRADAKSPGGKNGGSAAAAGNDEQAVAQKIRNRANEIKGANPTRGFHDCWTQAQGELAK